MSQLNTAHTFLPLKKGHLSNKDTAFGPSGVLFKEVPKYLGFL